MDSEVVDEFGHENAVIQATEAAPLLSAHDDAHSNKPFYRPRPLWLVPFALTASIARGMTLAPRIEVYTQLSCNHLRAHGNFTTDQLHLFSYSTPLHYAIDPIIPHPHPQSISLSHPNQSFNLSFLLHPSYAIDDLQTVTIIEDDPRRIPSMQCTSNATVQAGAAALQTIMTTIMGFLSALTTGYWGHFGERHGRTKVLAISTFGLFITDVIFILASTPSSPLSAYGHRLLIVAPIIEGLLGGWSALQSATSAYLSDCTSSGSRAQIFSRFTGVFYIGWSVGPAIGGYFIRNPVWGSNELEGPMVTSVFWVSIICSFINFMLVLFVFPESLDKVKMQQKSAEEHVAPDPKDKGKSVAAVAEPSVSGPRTERSDGRRGSATKSLAQKLVRPLRIFLPVVLVDDRLRKRKDWNLTLLGLAFFGYMLSTGVQQVKYLYAEHIYDWNAEQLSYYISFIGGARAIFLLLCLPSIIAAFKPKPSTSAVAGPSSNNVVKGQKPKPTKAHLARSIAFDLLLTRLSFVVDIISNTLVAITPMPSYKIHALADGQPYNARQRSQALFVVATSLGSLGSGAIPAMQSLALCIMQLRGRNKDSGEGTVGGDKEGTGELFGALAVLQAVGQMILAPLLFGLVYSETVAAFPKAMFVAAAGILIGSLTLMTVVRGPLVPHGKGKRRMDIERGRSRARKDLRGGAASYGSVSVSS